MTRQKAESRASSSSARVLVTGMPPQHSASMELCVREGSVTPAPQQPVEPRGEAVAAEGEDLHGQRRERVRREGVGEAVVGADELGEPVAVEVLEPVAAVAP